MTQTAAVKTLLEINLEHYNRMLARCSESDREHAILKNGLLTPYGENPRDQRTVILLCKAQEAKRIMNLSRRLFPDAHSEIRKYAATE